MIHVPSRLTAPSPTSRGNATAKSATLEGRECQESIEWRGLGRWASSRHNSKQYCTSLEPEEQAESHCRCKAQPGASGFLAEHRGFLFFVLFQSRRPGCGSHSGGYGALCALRSTDPVSIALSPRRQIAMFQLLSFLGWSESLRQLHEPTAPVYWVLHLAALRSPAPWSRPVADPVCRVA